ncbi:hypothetical protein HYPSUDRAFT_169640 [Hypholoma sublateritium FD-334 SS-4]|uniref:Peptidase S8/S53 domain-containing protein n=1 Tax=Hypholoma sublateritium (strain FD-334 SS-4) TaxID=945553 RepID=A0A0D2KU86_HYPSF|nr:hypothetical protein HYPSUDRAFT_169640 [Hypholoma sublateritium FD-334 SS-4]
MRCFTALLAIFAVLVAGGIVAPGPLLPVQHANGAAIGKYIVRFKEGASRKEWVNRQGVSHAVDWPHTNGLAATLSTDALNSLRASPGVELISEDGIAHGSDMQMDETWGLQRISAVPQIQNPNLPFLAYNYTYEGGCGDGVDIYILDTDASEGVYLDHVDFEGRATWGLSVESYAQVDGNGHGTHVAGTAAGKIYGVAKQAHIIAVKVLDDTASGSYSGIITGLNWVIDQVQVTGRPSIVSMSLEGSANDVFDAAVASVVSAGIHTVVAAGNDNTDAIFTSPARVPTAITVGATDITDTRAYFSNYGSVVDVFAPGTNVLSAWIGGTTNTNILSGTSMATPHVAGIIACLISTEGNLTPADFATKLQNYAVKGVLSDIPSSTDNYLAHNSAL